MFFTQTNVNELLEDICHIKESIKSFQKEFGTYVDAKLDTLFEV